ncbi:UDP-N-acetylmuramoyl-L-alanyl-D-glutamate--2,6-diaminopimelate ligase [Promicromonospora citrea]|uniref:UDP-N-acetylmuramyl-tripeptide synthetase n=1 Tax=Promicromonospora citrea TaxID=43677 RepID=A0A8H9L5L7_9MICO|nr:UDP-N-acetylmuramoyl-L-alanyl-D-glutamate--2,6-diaminopimelate ligase [Promicromonospora citrea]NNH52931.1 UDP-N-acetylmuramoyl-L-alanyl-D-glutamate--2,6-diaminopimelate ligase [Promicromonospora citrea]GGM39254.1 UDP-N-acetylmuramoyl-L-alanyl-D-glutamate--2,6-diaminopimelate ligase [Promicromonospora citrea]
MTSPIDRIRPAATTARQVSELAVAFGLSIAPGQSADAAVTCVASDNRVVQDGDLFVALPGARAHGAQFAADAVRRGAAAILTDARGAELIGAGSTTPVVVADDPRAILGSVAAWVLGNPAEDLMTFGVTGTNGKTTTTYQLDHLLRALGWTGGLIGTVETRSGDRVIASTLTTPEAADLQALLAAMREDHVRTLAMEVSSHALAQHRVDGIVFGVAGFTNLTQDHLDFHGDFETYFATKAELFTPARARRGVVTVDDAWGERMAAEAQIPVATLTTLPGKDADWTVTDVEPSGTGSAFTLTHHDGRTLRTSTSLPGGYNVANAALAVAMVLEGGSDIRDVTDALAAADGLSATVPGRMEVLATAPRVVVDFAHNTEALELALAALRPSTTGKLAVVFGATGDRDPGKRPFMGAAAVHGADVVYVTDDDPHDEDPAKVRTEVLAGTGVDTPGDGTPGSGTPGTVETADDGASRTVEVHEVAPRADAIRAAILAARLDDTVLVAGRGHETIQEVAGVDHVLDDRVEARAALAARTA